MAIPTYPFDDRFRVLVDEQYGWSCFVNTDEPFIKAFEDAGYSKKQVQDFVKNLKEKPLDELVCLALRDDSDESPALIVLQQRTSRDVFDRAILLCASDNPKDRALGVEIVMRKPELHYRDEAVATVCRMAKLEADPEVLEVLAYALSHLDVDGRSEYLQSIATNPAAETRMAAAYSLSCLDDDLAVSLLIDLSADKDGDVRNWATFGLQPNNKERRDRQEIKDALYARVQDPHEECRHEALLGLAEYKDERVLAPLIDALSSASVWKLAVEAAECMAHPDLYPHLARLRDWWNADSELLDHAITACSSNAHSTQS